MGLQMHMQLMSVSMERHLLMLTSDRLTAMRFKAVWAWMSDDGDRDAATLSFLNTNRPSAVMSFVLLG